MGTLLVSPVKSGLLPRLSPRLSLFKTPPISDWPVVAFPSGGAAVGHLGARPIVSPTALKSVHVCKAFSPRELVARVKAVLRRKGATTNEARGLLQFGRLEIDERAREVRIDGTDVKLKPRESTTTAPASRRRNAKRSSDWAREAGRSVVRGPASDWQSCAQLPIAPAATYACCARPSAERASSCASRRDKRLRLS